VNSCLESVRMSLTIDGAWFSIRLRVPTVYFVNFGQVFQNDAVVQKLRKSMCHKNWTFVCPPVKFQAIILRRGAAFTVETGRCEGETLRRAIAQSRSQPSRSGDSKDATALLGSKKLSDFIFHKFPSRMRSNNPATPLWLWCVCGGGLSDEEWWIDFPLHQQSTWQFAGGRPKARQKSTLARIRSGDH